MGHTLAFHSKNSRLSENISLCQGRMQLQFFLILETRGHVLAAGKGPPSSLEEREIEKGNISELFVTLLST